MARKRTGTGRRPADFVRRFPANGMKLLLEHPLNVRDLLRAAQSKYAPSIDFARMRRAGTTFVQRDYRHVECDVVLTAPFRGKGKAGRARTVLLYVLIEHQSEPEGLMILRVLDYVVQIYRHQEREARRLTKGAIQLTPVLPVVFSTGTLSWEGVGRLSDVVELAEEFGDQVPALEPLFVNLSTLGEDQLTREGGYFGRLLHLVQQRRAPAERFEGLLRREVGALEAMRPKERTRWQELLSYLVALVYHDRDPGEHPRCQEVIEAAVAADPERREVSVMGKSMADVLREEGQKLGEKLGEKKGELRAQRRTLLFQMEEKFGEVPAETLAKVKSTKDVKQLEQWLKRLVTAKRIEDLQIGS
jgi:hypothetical protein